MPFTILTVGGPVTAQIYEEGRSVKVDMGTVSFESTKIPVAGPPREVLEETLEIQGESLSFCAATVGNPHCVLLRDEISSELAHQFGPAIETHPLFPKRTNVQFMQILDRNSIKIEIWERGAGYTLASGSSSSAAAAVAYKLGLCDSRITVRMPGGNIEIEISPEYAITMTGPVTRVCEGYIDGEIFDD
jgi:diaminopimelate epimerase